MKQVGKVYYYNDVPFGIRHCKGCSMEIMAIDEEGWHRHFCKYCEYNNKLDMEKEKRLKLFRKLNPDFFTSKGNKGSEK